MEKNILLLTFQFNIQNNGDYYDTLIYITYIVFICSSLLQDFPETGKGGTRKTPRGQSWNNVSNIILLYWITVSRIKQIPTPPY